ncbi:hypothetical protein ACIBOV_05030 [Micromonospora chersina]
MNRRRHDHRPAGQPDRDGGRTAIRAATTTADGTPTGTGGVS